jgi:hypothetical protein
MEHDYEGNEKERNDKETRREWKEEEEGEKNRIDGGKERDWKVEQENNGKSKRNGM